MRKQKWIYIGISVLLLGMTGCATEQNNINTIPSPTTMVEKKENTKIPTATIVSNPTTMPTPSVVEFSLKDFNSYNRMLSMDTDLGTFGKSLFHVDEQTGITYFVNQGKDYYLYQIKEGKTELVVNMPVKELYSYQGLLYFMVNDYGIYELEGMQNGDIYCYIPETNTIEFIYGAGTIENSTEHKLSVENDSIYFSYEKENDEGSIISFWQLPFETMEVVRDMQLTTMKGWNKYFLSFNPNLILQSRITGQDGTKEIIELTSSKTRFCVVEDTLYSAERTYISCIDLVTGEKTGYDFLEEIKKVQGQEIIDDSSLRIIESFVITKEAVWITTGSYLYCMDLKNGEVECVYILDKKNNPCYIETLYTNGEEVYGVQEVSKDTKKLVRILTKEIEEESLVGLPVIRIEDAVK